MEKKRKNKKRDVPRGSTFSIVRRVMIEHGRPHIRSYLIVIIFMAIVAGCTSLSALLMKNIVNTSVTSEASFSPLYYPLLISGLFITKGLFSYLQEVWATKIGASIVADIQRKLYDHLLRMDVAFFHRRSSSELITRMSNGANAVRDAINLTIVRLGRDLLTVLGLSAVMISQQPILFLIVLATAPIAALILRRLSTAAKEATQSEAGGMAEVLSLTRETTQGIRMLKSFQLEDLMQERMSASIAAIEDKRNRLAKVKASVAPISEILSGVAIGAVVLYATLSSQGNPESLGAIFAFITALLLAGEPIRRLSRLHIDLATAAERISMLYFILDQTQIEPQADSRPELDVTNGNITLTNVSFSYPESDKGVLRNISLSFEGGKLTALVGASGGGKTTILGLIQGFFPPASGQIEIDGVSIREVSLKSLRRNISYLDQDAFLFEGTIEDNIVGASDVRDPSRVAEAARNATADTFVSKMPEGYDTKLRELSTNLSGGQKQRIAIARAFYKNAPILLLDEPTSALDSDTEQQIRSSIRNLAEGRTTIMIAHRLSTVRDADFIYVISDGQVAEAGTHEELLVRNGIYAGLLEGQSRDDDRPSQTSML